MSHDSGRARNGRDGLADGVAEIELSCAGARLAKFLWANS